MNTADQYELEYTLQEAKAGLREFCATRVKTQQRIAFYEARLDELSRVTSLTENDTKTIEDYRMGLPRLMDGIAEATLHINIIKQIINKLESK